jgi:hypothetical protein
MIKRKKEELIGQENYKYIMALNPIIVAGAYNVGLMVDNKYIKFTKYFIILYCFYLLYDYIYYKLLLLYYPSH